uniref:Uncharacterized protein n=1 Tax=Anguilla anguilla TaxID=7936 RepID=A0A0E9PAR5_ANGAN
MFSPRLNAKFVYYLDCLPKQKIWRCMNQREHLNGTMCVGICYTRMYKDSTTKKE